MRADAHESSPPSLAAPDIHWPQLLRQCSLFHWRLRTVLEASPGRFRRHSSSCYAATHEACRALCLMRQRRSADTAARTCCKILLTCSAPQLNCAPMLRNRALQRLLIGILAACLLQSAPALAATLCGDGRRKRRSPKRVDELLGCHGRQLRCQGRACRPRADLRSDHARCSACRACLAAGRIPRDAVRMPRRMAERAVVRSAEDRPLL
jgi:hypothetical protein